MTYIHIIGINKKHFLSLEKSRLKEENEYFMYNKKN